MRHVLLACLLIALLGCNTRAVPREERRVTVLEEGRLGGTTKKVENGR
jgi:hypothetical protein